MSDLLKYKWSWKKPFTFSKVFVGQFYIESDHIKIRFSYGPYVDYELFFPLTALADHEDGPNNSRPGCCYVIISSTFGFKKYSLENIPSVSITKEEIEEIYNSFKKEEY